jgi:hypothetical protein
MDGHQVVGFAPRFWKALGEEIVERREIFNLSVLAGSHPTEVTTELDEARVLFLVHGALPGQYLVDFVQDEQASMPIQFRLPENAPVRRQMRPANQDRLLLVAE